MALFDKKDQNAGGMVPGEAECDRRLAELAQERVNTILQIGQVFLAGNSIESVKGTPYEVHIKKVEAIDKETDYQEKRKLALRGLRKCEKCGNILVLDSSFCNKCGEKLQPLFVNDPVVGNVCPQCGAPVAEGAAFCTSCGKKIEQ